MKDSELVKREAGKLYERSRTELTDERAAPYFVGGRILDAIALVLKNQEKNG